MFDDGNVDNFKVENNRVSFKLNNKTYACFEKTQDGNDNQAAKDAKAIIINDSSARVAIEYYDNTKDDKTYHNLTKIEISNASPIKEELVSTDTGEKTLPNQINGAEFGLCCHLSQRMCSALGEPFLWDKYEDNIKKFYDTNKKIKGEIYEDLQKPKE